MNRPDTGRPVVCYFYPAVLFLLAVVVCIISAGYLNADVLYLKNGQTIRGIVTRDGKRYIVDMGYGKAVFEPKDVEKVVKEQPADFYKKNAFALLKEKKFPQALEQAELWKKNGGTISELEEFQDSYFTAAAHYLLDRGLYGKAEALLSEIKDSSGKPALVERLTAFRNKTDILLENASDYYRNKRYQAALKAYRELYFHCPEKLDDVRKEFSNSCIKAGDDLFNRGEFDQADTLYSSGFSIDPRLFDVLKDKWASAKLEAFRKNSTQKESLTVIRALADLVPENLTVMHLAGKALLEGGDIAEAYSYFSEIAGVSPLLKGIIPEKEQLFTVQKLAEDVLKDRTIPQPRKLIISEETGYYILPDDNFVISSEQSEAVQRAYVVMNHFFRRLQEQFSEVSYVDNMKKTLCAVILFPDKESFQKAGGGEAEQGTTKLVIADGKPESVTILSHLEADGLFLSVLAHELGHAVLSSLTLDDGTVPLCIQEGFAVFSEPLFKHTYYRDLLRNYLAQRKLPRLNALLATQSYPGNQSLFYALSYSVVDAYIAKEGADRFISFVIALKGEGVDKALQKYSSWKSVSGFEKYWREHVRTEMVKRNNSIHGN